MKNSNDKIRKICQIVIPIILIIVGVIYGYGQLNHRVKTVEEEVKKAEDTRERLIRVEEGVEYLKKAVDRIEEKL